MTATKCPLCRDRGVFARWSIEDCDGDFIEPDEYLDGESETPDDVPYWAPGEPIRYRSAPVETARESVMLLERRTGRVGRSLTRINVGNTFTRWTEEAPCSCTAIASDYDERKQARADRRVEKSAALREQSATDRQRSLDMLPDFGQPILVGHHSERGHRRLLERSNKLMSGSVEKAREALRLERMAAGARGTTEISADDPHAPAKLRARAWWIEWQHEEWKAQRKRDRKAGKKVERDGGHDSANIKRLRKRADEIEQARARKIPDEVRVGDFLLTWDADENRVQIYSPRPSTPEQREKQSEAMRRAGFRWARSIGCWQRQASMQAWHLGKDALARLMPLTRDVVDQCVQVLRDDEVSLPYTADTGTVRVEIVKDRS